MGTEIVIDLLVAIMHLCTASEFERRPNQRQKNAEQQDILWSMPHQSRLEDRAQKLCARCKALGAGKRSDVNAHSCDNARATIHQAIMQELERRVHAVPLELR